MLCTGCRWHDHNQTGLLSTCIFMYTCSWLLRSDMKCELVMPSNIITLPTQFLFGLFLIVSGIDLISEWLIVFLHNNYLYVLYIMLNTYLQIGQRHGGFMGMIQRALSRATDHIWFERSMSRDRSAVANRQ